MFESPIPPSHPDSTNFGPVRTHDASPAQILQNQAREANTPSKTPAHQSSLPAMSNIPSEPEFQQAYNGMSGN